LVRDFGLAIALTFGPFAQSGRHGAGIVPIVGEILKPNTEVQFIDDLHTPKRSPAIRVGCGDEHEIHFVNRLAVQVNGYRGQASGIG
jgi:hypothetical protein